MWKVLMEAVVAAAAAGLVWWGFSSLLVEAGLSSHWSGVAAAVLLALPLFYRLFGQRVAMERLRQRMEEAHLRDDVTGLAKAHVFKEMAATQIRLCKRNDWPVSLVFFEIDQLDALERRHGYDSANRALRRFADALTKAVRESDLTGRFDEERFALLLPDCELDAAKKVVQRLQVEILSQPLETEEGERVKMTFSAGVVALSGRVARFNALMTRCGEALEEAKRKGGNRISLF